MMRGCKEDSQVFLSLIFSCSNILCMLNNHIILTLTISSIFWFCHVCLCLSQRFYFFSKFIYFLDIRILYSYETPSHLQGCFLFLWCCFMVLLSSHLHLGLLCLLHVPSISSFLCYPAGQSVPDGVISTSEVKE